MAMAFDTMQRQVISRAENAQANVIRNKLQLVARDIQKRIYQLNNNEQRTVAEVCELVGEIKGYLSARQALSPCVAPDGYMKELSAWVKKLEKPYKQS
ncbi:hypothetical protein [Rheinheimera sp.]|uniref:hypothetical protein n=1 Tax=Rheinheimera sp. TaxID=1869214 RepID=UPI004047BBA5